MRKYFILNDGKEANLEDFCREATVCVCEENGGFGREFMYFTKQDLIDMLALFEEGAL